MVLFIVIYGAIPRILYYYVEKELFTNSKYLILFNIFMLVPFHDAFNLLISRMVSRCEFRYYKKKIKTEWKHFKKNNRREICLLYFYFKEQIDKFSYK